MHLFIDTETTGVFNFKLPVIDPSQPRIVQLGAILCDENQHVMAEINLLVKPDGWTIPKEASDIHGITNEIADRYGMPVREVMRIFTGLVNRSHVVIAHSFDFDSNMVQREYNALKTFESLALFTLKESFCTMKATTDLVKLPNKNGFGGYKWPKLQEAYKFLFNEEFEGAHDAMADVRACKRIYYHPSITMHIKDDTTKP